MTTLRWDGDDLVDFADGPDRWRLDGTVDIPSIRRSFGLPFDRGLVSPSGRFQAVYAERGTKALLLQGGEIVRELTRDPYPCAADTIDYPIALGALSDGREVVVHCPDHPYVLQIDDAQTGQRLTDGPRDQPDVYQSRLSISPDGRRLMTAGERYGNDEVMIFDLDLAVRDASALDGDGIMPLDAYCTDVAAACWLDSDRVVIATTDHEPLFDDADALGPRQLGVWSVSQSRWLHRATVGYPMGTLIACGSRVITLYGHPQLLDPITGDVIAEWPDVPIGTTQGSYEDTNFPTPIAALHPDRTRLAIAEPDAITILTLPSP
ncbi:hypothetical protein [Rhizocola hellebori]|uniref:hypothetical protein n=1 Tax=Rhizocola hellebori TaxID=1392758 RepID=UPI0019454A91|nr:hypothetical protein [Rhizocola hellebori]